MSETKGWTAERIALLQTYLNQGLSASKIAEKLDCGLSRNAVVGMIHRRGLRLARGAGRAEAVEQRRETYATQRRERRHKSEKPDLPRGEAGCFAKHPGKVAPAPQRALSALPVVQDASRTSPKAAPEVHYSEPQNLPLIDLDLGQCRYATGFDGKSRRHLFCGMAVHEDSPYCPAHHEISYHKISRNQRRRSDRDAIHHGQSGTIFRTSAKWLEA